MTTMGERMAVVETEVKELKQQFTDHQSYTSREFADINNKLDDLLALRNKGAGVFWLISSLIGAGIVGGAFQFLEWVKGVFH